MSYYIYILTNKSNTLYIGVTNNLERRLWEHKNKLIPGFTSKYNMDKLVYYQEFNRIEDAIVAEKKIKGWTRKKKMVLIKTINPEFKDLFSSSETSSEILRNTPFLRKQSLRMTVGWGLCYNSCTGPSYNG